MKSLKQINFEALLDVARSDDDKGTIIKTTEEFLENYKVVYKTFQELKAVLEGFYLTYRGKPESDYSEEWFFKIVSMMNKGTSLEESLKSVSPKELAEMTLHVLSTKRLVDYVNF